MAEISNGVNTHEPKRAKEDPGKKRKQELERKYFLCPSTSKYKSRRVVSKKGASRTCAASQGMRSLTITFLRVISPIEVLKAAGIDLSIRKDGAQNPFCDFLFIPNTQMLLQIICETVMMEKKLRGTSQTVYSKLYKMAVWSLRPYEKSRDYKCDLMWPKFMINKSLFDRTATDDVESVNIIDPFVPLALPKKG